MAETIAELQERKKTDRRLSFGLYLVFLLVVIIISIIVGGIGRLIGGFGAGRIVSMIVSLLVAIYVWWYNWLLYKRRNEHFDRIKRLKTKLSSLMKEKFKAETGILMRVDLLLDRREAHHSNLLFGLWLILSYSRASSFTTCWNTQALYHPRDHHRSHHPLLADHGLLLS